MKTFQTNHSGRKFLSNAAMTAGGTGSRERTNEARAYEKTGFYHVVVNAILKTGFTSEEIGKVGGGNYLRIFGEAVKG